MSFKNEVDKSTIEALVQIISKPIHQKNRHKVLKTHEGFWGQSTTMEAALKKMIQYTLSRREQGITPKTSYISSLASSLQKMTGIPKNVMVRSYQNLLKLLNSQNMDPIFYSGNVKFSIENLPKGRIKVVENKPMYTEIEIQLITNYCVDNLNIFFDLNKNTQNIIPPIRYETLLFMIILISSGRRTKEILGLTRDQIDSLILTNHTEIKNKSGTGVDEITIPGQVAGLLERYINLLPEDMPLFSKSYDQHYSEGFKIYKTLFNKSARGKRIFHSFRNFMSYRGLGVDGETTRGILGHRSMEMTKYYAKRQELSSVNGKKEGLLSDLFNDLLDKNKRVDKIQFDDVYQRTPTPPPSTSIPPPPTPPPSTSIQTPSLSGSDSENSTYSKSSLKGGSVVKKVVKDVRKNGNGKNKNATEITNLKTRLKIVQGEFDSLTDLANSRLDILSNSILIEKNRKKYDKINKRVTFANTISDDVEMEGPIVNKPIPTLEKLNDVTMEIRDELNQLKDIQKEGDKNLDLALVKINNSIKDLEDKNLKNIDRLDLLLIQLQKTSDQFNILNRESQMKLLNKSF